MTQGTESQLLDYSKPPPGYAVRFEDSSVQDGSGPPLWWWGDPHYAASVESEAEALAAAWAHYKAHNDPPGLDVNAWGFGQRGIEAAWWRPLSDDAALASARTAAWAWYDRRLAVHARVADDPRHRIDFCGSCGAENEPQEEDECPECGSTSSLISTWGEQQAERYRTGERYTDPDPGIDDASPTWPRCLTWSDEQVAEVERWLVDSTAELPEVLRG
jgi:predicted RNA-binding Zn-ribbon protein involved in translation (DUF1610 family)